MAEEDVGLFGRAAALIHDPEGDHAELKDVLERLLQTLPFHEREVVKLRYGVGDGYTYTQEQVRRIFKVTPGRIRVLEERALRRLRHPARVAKLEPFFREGVSDA